ncbi:tyrosine-type recombinase/integrase [Mariniflexile gromovii]|uniref:tyrosine-type recombinase/integrase n=1 Tax=Mariniflexile gromovii TaxID=362523 RepID=UPI001FD7CF58|nr:tyrosine-type recombinase/integrase [Mariniflexile gromovii]
MKKTDPNITRHTVSTTVTLTNGVPIESVSNIHGHKNLRTTHYYTRVLNRKVSYYMRTLK